MKQVGGGVSRQYVGIALVAVPGTLLTLGAVGASVDLRIALVAPAVVLGWTQLAGP